MCFANTLTGNLTDIIAFYNKCIFTTNNKRNV